MSKIKFVISILFCLSVFNTYSQLDYNTYWVQFSDKNNSIYDINSPQVFLSQRAIERRERYQIPVDSLDLPVNQWYLDSVRNKGAVILNPSRWFNGTTIYTEDHTVIDSINNLPFAKVFAKPSFAPFSLDHLSWGSSAHYIQKNDSKLLGNTSSPLTDNNYGEADLQIRMLKGKDLHKDNYLGQGMLIAILDAGFGSGGLSFIRPLIEQGQIEYTWDFIAQDTNVFNDHYHGKAVLSTMGAQEEGVMVGTAPLAHYLLFRTENVFSENLIEEFNWISACELADQMGSDLINSSLGYHQYDIANNSYTWEDLNGRTAPISIASNIVASRGILLFCSAGNDGANSWKRISPPADAEGCVTVGAVNRVENIASFSSIGNTSDGRIKPNLMALGAGSYGIKDSLAVPISGTSFSSPILCGMTACLWQVDKNKTNFEIKALLEQYGSQTNHPDSLKGYGIPDFQRAYQSITADIQIRTKGQNEVMNIYPTCFDDAFKVKLFTQKRQIVKLKILNMKGIEVYQTAISCPEKSINTYFINGLQHLQAGVYIVHLLFGDRVINKKVIKK